MSSQREAHLVYLLVCTGVSMDRSSTSGIILEGLKSRILHGTM